MKFLLTLFCCTLSLASFSKNTPSAFSHMAMRWQQIWQEGKNELYLTGYAWHNRYTYSRERIPTYNEFAGGGGLGKGFLDEDRDLHALYAFAFLDSHKKIEPVLGYAFLKMAYLGELGMGLGFTTLITARPDIFHNIPFPGILPWTSLVFRQVSLAATYIPGSHQTGNVLFILAKWTFY